MKNIIDWAAQTLSLRNKNEKMLRINDRKMPYLEIAKADRPGQPLIVGIHGFGANEQQMQTLVNISPDIPHTYIAPRALHPHPTGGHMWFDIEFDGENALFENDRVTDALDAIDAFIEKAIKEYDADPGRVVLIGYSQGGMLAFPYFMRHSDRVAAVASLAGSFGEQTPQWSNAEDYSGKRLFIGYGTKDPLVRPQEMFRAKQYFAERNTTVTYKQYPIPHVVSQQEVADLEEWLTAFIGEK